MIKKSSKKAANDNKKAGRHLKVHGAEARQYLKRRKVKVVDWPANSPDFNPIERVWAVMKATMKKERRGTNLASIQAAGKKAWNAFDQDTVRKLVLDRFPRVLAEAKRIGYETVTGPESDRKAMISVFPSVISCASV